MQGGTQRDRRGRGMTAPGGRLHSPGHVAAWESARAVADAVLYEGYLLYPYRKIVPEEPGAVAVRRARAAAVGRGAAARVGRPSRARRTRGGSAPSASSRPGPRARLRVCLRFLQPQRRSVQPAAADGAFVEVDELEVDGERHLTFDEAVPSEFDVDVDSAGPPG